MTNRFGIGRLRRPRGRPPRRGPCRGGQGLPGRPGEAIMNHLVLPRFWQSYRRLPDAIRQLADRNYALLRADSRHPSLHFKKVGKTKQLWSVRVGEHYRAVGVEKPGWHRVVLDRAARGMRYVAKLKMSTIERQASSRRALAGPEQIFKLRRTPRKLAAAS